jgi:predicted transcriptional regulator
MTLRLNASYSTPITNTIHKIQPPKENQSSSTENGQQHQGNSNSTQGQGSNPHKPNLIPQKMTSKGIFQTTSQTTNLDQLDENAYEINSSLNTYMEIELAGNYSDLSLYSILGATYGLDPQKNWSWALFNTTSQQWYLIPTILKDGIISVNLSEYRDASDKYVVCIVEIIPIPVTPFLLTPLGLFLIIFATVIILFGLLMTNEEYRSYILNRIMPIYKGPHRLNIEEVLENETRINIINYILEQPGIHYNELMRKLGGISAGNLTWHLEILETFKIIQKEKLGQYLVYSPYLAKNPVSMIDIKLYKSKTTLEIMNIIQNHPGYYQNQIAKEMHLDHKTVKYHLEKLLEANLVRSEVEGRSKKFFSID